MIYNFVLVQNQFLSLLTSVTYCLHFVDVIVVNNVIEGGVELVKEVHDLVGSAGTRQLGKADNITVTWGVVQRKSPLVLHVYTQTKKTRGKLHVTV